MPRAFGIGWLAAEAGRSVHTIRWYERQGLLPGVTRDSGGRRVFTPEHVQWLMLMHRLRQTGMSVAEMRKYTALVMQGRRTLDERRRMLAAHRERIAETIVAWQQALRLIDHKIDFYGEWLATGVRPRNPFPRMKAGSVRSRRTPPRRRGAALRPPSQGL